MLTFHGANPLDSYNEISVFNLIIDAAPRDKEGN